MKFELIIDENVQEKVVVYAKEKTQLVKKIQNLLQENEDVLYGYIDREAVRLEAEDVYCFVVEDNKVFALTRKEKYRVKLRIYQLENRYENFVKINQSCMVNIKYIHKFEGSFSGVLKVRMKNGYIDYVSRRNVKKVKERLGLK